MIRVCIFAEGHCEQVFLNDVVREYLFENNISISTILISPGGKGGNKRGGVIKYGSVKKQIQDECKRNRNAFITTMIDLYKLPTDFPGYEKANDLQDPLKKVEYLESEMKKDIRSRNFIANFTVYEFETLLYSDPAQFQRFGNETYLKLESVRRKFASPEHIDGGKETGPANRIISIYPKFSKTKDGVNIAKKIGLEKIRKECRHFNAWIERLVNLSHEPAKWVIQEIDSYNAKIL